MATLASVLILLLYSGKTDINGQIITVPVELHTTVDVPCRCHICPESTIAVQWYRSSNTDVFVENGIALASWSKRRTGSSEGFGIKDDFSMIIYKLTDQHNQDLFRCLVIPVGEAAECTHDVRLSIYANPDTSPVIEYIRQTNGFNVTCSISNVYPMAFPMLTTKEENGTAFINRDGTYNTTVTQWFSSNETDTTIQCLYSHLNFKSMSSLRIVDSDNIDQNTTHPDFMCRPSGLWMLWIILVEEVLVFIVFVYAIKTGRGLFNSTLRKAIRNNTDDLNQDEHHGEDSKEEEPAKSTSNLLFGKLSCAVITITIHITIALILLVAYLATARCLIEASGFKNEMFQQNC